MGYVDVKPAPSPSVKSSTAAVANGSVGIASLNEASETRNINQGSQNMDSGNPNPMLQAKSIEGNLERTDVVANVRSEHGQSKLKAGPSVNGFDSATHVGSNRLTEISKHGDEPGKGISDGNTVKVPIESVESKVIIWSTFRLFCNRSTPMLLSFNSDFYFGNNSIILALILAYILRDRQYLNLFCFSPSSWY